jgi:hypothetical protein
MFIVVWIVIGGIFALICSSMANARGRSGGLWGVLGFFLGLIAVLILAIIGNAQTNSVAIAYVPQGSHLDELAKLKSLLDSGVLSQAEFEAQKRKLLT